MKTAFKFISGLCLASALMVGCGANGNFNFHSSETRTVTDANGNTTTTSTTNDNGKVTTTTTKNGETVDKKATKKSDSSSSDVMIKNCIFTNDTDLDFEKIEIKTDNGEDYKDILNGDTLKSGTSVGFSECKVGTKVKTMSFRITTKDGGTAELKNLKVSKIKNLDKPTFDFTRDGNKICVNLK